MNADAVRWKVFKHRANLLSAHLLKNFERMSDLVIIENQNYLTSYDFRACSHSTI